jgi:hypothetical protein
MRKINQINLNQFFAARHIALLQNLAREQKSLATPVIYINQVQSGVGWFEAVLRCKIRIVRTYA